MNEEIKWAPRITPMILERLYQLDAMGLEDSDLCDNVAYRLFLRCQAIVMVARNEVSCPRCDRTFTIETTSPETVTTCPALCGWETTMLNYRQSWSKKRIWAANALPAFEEYDTKYSPALSYKEKMILIDRLIHSFHWSMKEQQPARSAANNLLEGNHDEVVTFLDNLTTLDPKTKSAWRETMHVMMERRKGK